MLSIAKLQNLKAIHNLGLTVVSIAGVVINRKTTKFESNSQHPLVGFVGNVGCYQSQNYKIWKQFTTMLILILNLQMLLSIAKLQNLKAIHNKNNGLPCKGYVVINRKTTKFESNSQLELFGNVGRHGCYQSQNYKIWKQFTTVSYPTPIANALLSIAKLQNLKAIHNPSGSNSCVDVVINRKTTKFESNSQLWLKFLIVNKNYKAPNTTLGASLCKIKTSLTI